MPNPIARIDRVVAERIYTTSGTSVIGARLFVVGAWPQRNNCTWLSAADRRDNSQCRTQPIAFASRQITSSAATG